MLLPITNFNKITSRLMEDNQLTKLAYSYTFWFSFFKENRLKQVEDYESNIKPIGDFGTAEEFWGYY